MRTLRAPDAAVARIRSAIRDGRGMSDMPDAEDDDVAEDDASERRALLMRVCDLVPGLPHHEIPEVISARVVDLLNEGDPVLRLVATTALNIDDDATDAEVMLALDRFLCTESSHG